MKQRARDIALILAATVLTYLVITYRVYEGDHQLTIPFMYKFGDPSLFPGDITIDLYAHYTVLSFLVIRPVVDLLGLEAAFLLLHLAAVIALFASIVALSRVVSDHPWVPIIAILSYAVPKYVAGGVWTIDSALVSRHLAYPLVLWGFWAVLRQRWLLAALLLGLGFDVHPITGISAILAAAMLAFPNRRSLISKTGIAAVVLGSIVILPVFIARGGVSGESTLRIMDSAWAYIVHITNRDHFFPSDYPVVFLLPIAGMVVLLFIGTTAIENPAVKLGLRLAGGLYVVLFLINLVFTEIWTVQLVVLSSLMRYALIVAPLATVAFSVWLVKNWSDPRLRWLIAGIAVPFATEYRIRTGWGLIFVLALIVIVPRLKQYFVRIPWWLIFGLAVANAYRVHQRAAPIPYPSAVDMEIVFASAVIVLGVATGWLYEKRQLLATPAALAGLILLGLLIKAGAYSHFGLGIRVADIPRDRPTPVMEAAAWARENTPPDALFIADPESPFRASAMRSTYGNSLDGTYSNLSRDFAFVWEVRMKTLCRYDRLYESACRYREHTAESFRAMARDAKATHVLVEKAHPALDLPLVYENAAYRIHQIDR